MRLRENEKSRDSVVFLPLIGRSGAGAETGRRGLFLLGPLGVKTPIKCKEQNTLKAGALTLAMIPTVALFT